MKHLHFSILFLLSLSLLTVLSCKSTQSSTASQAFIPLSMEDLLRREPGLNLTGSGSNLIVRIRGNSSIQGNNDPLFVLDGTPIGNGYAAVSSLDPLSVGSIRVITGAKAGIYGARGSNGVIVIQTKKE